MIRIPRWFKSVFSPKEMQNLDSVELLEAMNDPVIRKRWMFDVYEELKKLNLDVERKLLSGSEVQLINLCSRRKAFQDVLEWILQEKRNVKSKMTDHNHRRESEFDLDRVTV